MFYSGAAFFLHLSEMACLRQLSEGALRRTIPVAQKASAKLWLPTSKLLPVSVCCFFCCRFQFSPRNRRSRRRQLRFRRRFLPRKERLWPTQAANSLGTTVRNSAEGRIAPTTSFTPR